MRCPSASRSTVLAPRRRVPLLGQPGAVQIAEIRREAIRCCHVAHYLPIGSDRCGDNADGVLRSLDREHRRRHPADWRLRAPRRDGAGNRRHEAKRPATGRRRRAARSPDPARSADQRRSRPVDHAAGVPCSSDRPGRHPDGARHAPGGRGLRRQRSPRRSNIVDELYASTVDYGNKPAQGPNCLVRTRSIPPDPAPAPTPGPDPAPAPPAHPAKTTTRAAAQQVRLNRTRLALYVPSRRTLRVTVARANSRTQRA